MRNESLDFLRRLINTPSPVGHEARGQRVWLDYAGQFADETFSDTYGNCVAVLNKGGSPRVMLAMPTKLPWPSITSTMKDLSMSARWEVSMPP
jgi:hypothetical protein